MPSPPVPLYLGASQETTASANSSSVAFVEDYIAFTASSDDELLLKDEKKPKSEKARGKEPAQDAPLATERERGRGNARERQRSRERDDRRKRKYETIDLDDRYANKKQRMDAASRRAPWVYDVDWDDCKNVAEMLHKEVEAFTNWISPTPIEDEIRELTVAIISRAITVAFPDANVMPFGSYETKLYLPSGDIDLVIVSDSMAYSNKVSVLHSLAAVLRKAGITSNVTVIAKAKVPIIKFVTTHGRFNVDISINQINGVIGGQVIKGFLQSMTANGIALRSLVFITKLFLSQRSMNEVFTGGLGSYSIVCLAISFLQMHPKIRRGEIEPEKNLGVLVMEFFELYGCYFNYDEVGISVRDGGTYFSKRLRGWYDPHKRGCLSIEDPVDFGNDISSGSFGFPKVRTTLAGAHGILTSTAYLRAATINSKRQGRNFQLRKEFHPEDMSILSGVMGVTQEAINHRRLVKEVYDKRVLHNIMGVKPRAQVIIQEQPVEPERDSQNQQKRPRSPHSPPAKEKYSLWRVMEGSDTSVSHEIRGTSHRNDHDPEESGKYDIGKQPPRKRRRKDREENKHTVFIADDEDGTDDSASNVSTDEAEAREYAVNGEVKPGKPLSNADTEKKRNYWLSKGVGLREDINDSE
ncbi:Poly(A) RNA polymerase cid14 [Leucoagaricus sp. SymC.cos]|nr:Poly(A) RNA polymerase cid14 [Leucoagaricus sp. SymC.cos]